MKSFVKGSLESGCHAPSKKFIRLSTFAMEIFQCIGFVQTEVLRSRMDVVRGVLLEFGGLCFLLTVGKAL